MIPVCWFQAPIGSVPFEYRIYIYPLLVYHSAESAESVLGALRMGLFWNVTTVDRFEKDQGFYFVSSV